VPFPFVVLGNKVDKVKERRVPKARANDWCLQHANTTNVPLPYFETSAKSAVNVDEAFEELARRALEYEAYQRQTQPQLFIPPPVPPIDLQPGYDARYAEKKRKQACC